MEVLCTGNLTDDTTEEETVAPLGVIGTTHLRENSPVRRQYTDNRKFSECIHFRILQQFIETVLELNRLSFKSRDLFNQSLTAIMKLQQSDKRNKYAPHGGLSPRAKHRGKGTGNGYSRGCFVAVLLHAKKIGSINQYQTDKPLLGKEIRPAFPTPRKARPERTSG